jgi:hypothetical protein
MALANALDAHIGDAFSEDQAVAAVTVGQKSQRKTSFLKETSFRHSSEPLAVTIDDKECFPKEGDCTCVNPGLRRFVV